VPTDSNKEATEMKTNEQKSGRSNNQHMNKICT